MLRSLFSGVSGMKNNQIKMDVIANNISNVNTTAFKSGRVRFQDILSQTVKGASGPVGTDRGGVNPRQVGLGMTVSGVDTITNQGGLQPTGRPLDAAIDGEGYFVLSDGPKQVYTRDGAFNLDSEFNLVNSDGYMVMGYAAVNGVLPAVMDGANLSKLAIPEDKPGTSGATAIKINNFSIGVDGTIAGVYEDGSTLTLGRLALAKFANPGGLLKLGGNNYSVTVNSGNAAIGAAGDNGTGDVQQAVLEMSNVDLAGEFTDMIVTSRAFQANSRSITTSDEMLQELINLKR